MITGVYAKLGSTGMVEIEADVSEVKKPYTMHMICTNQDSSWPDYTVTTDFGLSVTRTSRWDVESTMEKLNPMFKKMAVLMFQTGQELIDANKKEEPKDEGGSKEETKEESPY